MAQDGLPTTEDHLLQSSRTFVVQFTKGAVGAGPAVSGRVEHIESAHSRRFQSFDELVSFLRDALVAIGAEP